ncbi:unnamed protein product [Symbiodinium necroappetens]|uniref:Uncharacterized protein n=1 Tax=Symbiodinium necroappetens TaxID=1628268 RepID=A0A812ZB92_9DINO|nr:unnamed protein product [Symbiodinium necroappetens]
MTDLPDVQLDSPSASRNLGLLDLPSPTSSTSPPRLPLRSRSAAALWQNARLSLVASPCLEHADQIYSTEAEGPGSDPTSRCSSPDGYQRRAVKDLRFNMGGLGSLGLESLALERRLAPEREEFLCQQLDEASDEIDRLCVERDDALKKVHDLAKVLREQDMAQEKSSRDLVSVARHHHDDGNSSDDNTVRGHERRRASCPANWPPPSPEQEASKPPKPKVDSASIFEERRHWHQELQEFESYQDNLKQTERELREEVRAAWCESQSAIERMSLQEVQMEVWRSEVAQAREMQSEEAVMRYKESISCSAQQHRLRQNLLTTLALQASLLVSGCFGAWSYTVPLVRRTVAVATECTMWLKRTAALAPCRRAEAPG